MAFCNPCVRPSNSSMVTGTQRSTPSIKSLLRRQLFKKSSGIAQSRAPVQRSVSHHSHTNARFQRIHGSNLVREVKPAAECSFKTNSSNNYDMTLFHDDQLDETNITVSHRRGKKVPRWARKSQLQLAFINQIYFNDNNPEDIFGAVRIDLVQEMVQSIEERHLPATHIYSSALCPPNFV